MAMICCFNIKEEKNAYYIIIKQVLKSISAVIL